MGSVHEVIEAFRTAPSNSERGTTFKKLMVRYFELDPTISQQYDAVRRWIDWPERQGKTDSGIDLNRCRMADVEYAWAITASVNWRRSDHSAPREMVSARDWNFNIPDRLGSGSEANGSGALDTTNRIGSGPNTSSVSLPATRTHNGPSP